MVKNDPYPNDCAIHARIGLSDVSYCGLAKSRDEKELFVCGPFENFYSVTCKNVARCIECARVLNNPILKAAIELGIL